MRHQIHYLEYIDVLPLKSCSNVLPLLSDNRLPGSWGRAAGHRRKSPGPWASDPIHHDAVVTTGTPRGDLVSYTGWTVHFLADKYANFSDLPQPQYNMNTLCVYQPKKCFFVERMKAISSEVAKNWLFTIFFYIFHMENQQEFDFRQMKHWASPFLDLPFIKRSKTKSVSYPEDEGVSSMTVDE